MAEEKSSGADKAPLPEKPKPLSYAKNSEQKPVSTTTFINNIKKREK